MGCGNQYLKIEDEMKENFIVRFSAPPGTNLTDFLTMLEVSFKCAGFCTPKPFYVFSNINRGWPKSERTCFEEL